MDYFCEECVAKNPKFPFDKDKAFLHSCQRCFRHRPVNDFSWVTGRPKPGPAPKPKDLVKEQVNPHAEVNLPKVKGHKEPEPVNHPPVAHPAHPHTPATPEADADKMLEAVQPNRPCVKLETIKKK